MSDDQNLWLNRSLIEYREALLPIEQLNFIQQNLKENAIDIIASFSGFDLNAKIAIPPRLNINSENLGSFLASFGLQQHFDLATAISYLHDNNIIIHNPTPSLSSWILNDRESYLTWRYNDELNNFMLIGFGGSLTRKVASFIDLEPNLADLHNPLAIDQIEAVRIEMQPNGFLPKNQK